MGVQVRGLESLQNFSTMLNRLPEDLKQLGVAWMDAVTTHAAERAELNAPVLTGMLRHLLKPMPIAVMGNRIRGGVYDMMRYATRMHEGIYNLGPISSIQPKMEEGGPGRKYITNVIEFHAERYRNLLIEMVGKLMRGQDYTSQGTLQPGASWFSKQRQFLNSRNYLARSMLGEKLFR